MRTHKGGGLQQGRMGGSGLVTLPPLVDGWTRPTYLAADAPVPLPPHMHSIAVVFTITAGVCTYLMWCVTSASACLPPGRACSPSPHAPPP